MNGIHSRCLCRGIFLTTVALLSGSASAAAADHLVHQWTFNDGTAKDSVGTAHGQLCGSAYIGNGALYLTGASHTNYMQSAALGASLTDRTLVSWCSLEHLTGSKERKSAGAVLSVMDATTNPHQFDGIVMGERTDLQWMNGSERWLRSPENNGGALETVASPEMVMMAITYSSNPYRMTIYRNGEIYVTHTYARAGYSAVLPTLSASSTALIGPRDLGSGFINGYIDEARIYDTCLTAEEIAAIYAAGPVPCPVSSPWNGSFEVGSPFTDFPADDANRRLPDSCRTLVGWYDEQAGWTDKCFILVVNRWNGYNPPDGYTQMWLEISQANDGADSEHCPAIQSGPLGNIVAGESYRIQADFTSGINASEWHVNHANVELLDVAAGDTIAQWSQVIPAAQTRVSCDFTSPVMDASRHGHPVRIRFAVPSFLDEHYSGCGIQKQFAIDNVRVSVVPNAVPVPGAATYTQADDGALSTGANWLGGVAPTGAVATLTFPARSSASTKVSRVEVDTALWVSNLVVADEHKLCTRVIEETDGGRFSLYAGGGVPTADIGTGLTRIRQLSAPDGFVKTGSGMLQIGGFRALGGTIDIRRGRVTVGDELAHRWSFNDGTARDLCGPADGTVSGNAGISNGALVVAGSNGQFITGDLGQALSNKALMVWTRLRDPAVSTKGSALSVCDTRSNTCSFDGIVYGEKTARYWMAGSEKWNRTFDVAGQTGSFAETATDEVQIAIGYKQLNGAIRITRNDVLYGDYGPSDYKASGLFVSQPTAYAIIGPRHYGNADTFDGSVNEARIYRYNLSMKSIASIAAAGPDAGTAHLGRAARIPAGARVRLGGDGTIFDLNMNAQTIDGLSGAGEVWNGTLAVAKELEVTGRIVIDGNLVIGENCRIRFTDPNAALLVKGTITLPAYATVAFDFSTATRGEKTFISSAVETDWSPLDAWDITEPKVHGFVFTEKRTATSFGYTCEGNGLLIILK